jgi:hypothetical protein
VTPTTFERRWAETITRTLLPKGALDGLLDGADVGARFADDCRESPWYAALLMRAVLYLVWLAPLWRLERLATFGTLDEPARVALLEALLAHRVYYVRMALTMLKLTLCTLVLGDEQVLARLGAYRLREPERLSQVLSRKRG